MSLFKHSVGAIVFLLILCGWMIFQTQRPTHPSDTSLVANFQLHRADFDKLIAMAKEDRDLIAIYPDQVMFADYQIWPKNEGHQFSWQRWNEYKGAFPRLGNYDRYGFSKRGDVLFFPVSIDSTESDEDYEYIVIEKGYAYTTHEPSPLVESLNRMGFNNKGTFYKRIDKDWYLYYDWGVGKPE